MTDERFDTLASLLEHKQNVILQGAPGVGKTFGIQRQKCGFYRNIDQHDKAARCTNGREQRWLCIKQCYKTNRLLGDGSTRFFKVC